MERSGVVVASCRRKRFKMWGIIEFVDCNYGFDLIQMVRDSGADVESSIYAIDRSSHLQGCERCEAWAKCDFFDRRENRFSATKKESVKIKLVLVTPVSLGFKSEEVALGKLYQSARKCGLSLCCEKIGMQIRAQYSDHPEGEIFVAMDPIVVIDCDPHNVSGGDRRYSAILKITNSRGINSNIKTIGMEDIGYANKNSLWAFIID